MKGIVILTSDVGGGHRSVTTALSQALKGFRVDIFDILAQGLPSPLAGLGHLYAPLVSRASPLWHVLWHLTDGRTRTDILMRSLSPMFGRRLVNFLKEKRPSMVVSTHPLAVHIPAPMVKGALGAPFVVMITDLVSIHPFWLHPQVDLCLVATERARNDATRRGFPKEKLQIVGLPIDPAFAPAGANREATRIELGLEAEQFTALVCGGGEGLGNIFELARSIAKSGLDLQLIVVAGRNRALKEILERHEWPIPIHITGFATNMPQLLQTADCLMGKAGPSTIAEALAAGLPMVLTNAIPGQEERNVDYVVEGGAGFYAPRPGMAIEAVGRLMSHDGTRERMADAASRLSNPHAARDAAEIIAHLMNKLPSSP